MKILALDSSGAHASACVTDGERLVSLFSVSSQQKHSCTLLPMAEEALKCAGFAVSDIDVFAVNAGPGSFTGVRIGVSAVKGIAFTGNLPCVSVSTLECMAENTAATPDTIICCLMDARCQQVYGALFEKDADGVVRRLTEDEALTVAQMEEKLSALNRPILLVGDGSELCYRVWKDNIPNVFLTPASARYQNAAATALVACRRFAEGLTLSAEALQPMYLRLPQAERELNARLNSK